MVYVAVVVPFPAVTKTVASPGIAVACVIVVTFAFASFVVARVICGTDPPPGTPYVYFKALGAKPGMVFPSI